MEGNRWLVEPQSAMVKVLRRTAGKDARHPGGLIRVARLGGDRMFPADVTCDHLMRNRIWAIARLIGVCMPEEFTFVEVGVYKGDMLKHLQELFAGMTYIGVDPWEELEASGDTAENRKTRRKIAQIVTMDSELAVMPRLMQMTSQDAAAQFEDKSLDMVYVDAGHTYQDAYDDFIMWFCKVKDGGVLCGHDYYPHIDYDAPMADGCRGIEDAAEFLGVNFVSDWPYSSTWSLVEGVSMIGFQEERHE